MAKSKREVGERKEANSKVKTVAQITNEVSGLGINDSNDAAANAEALAHRPQRASVTKTRLFVGEANFSFARAFCALRAAKPGVVSSITATEYMKDAEMQQREDKDKYNNNRQQLKAMGAKCFTNVDARKLDKYKVFASKRYNDIYFNFPHDGSNFLDRSLPEMLKQFFVSANKLQKFGDRIHITIPFPKNTKNRFFRESYIYRLFDAARASGYNLIERREFEASNHPGYQHTMTTSCNSAAITSNSKEYIFESTCLSGEQIANVRAPQPYQAYEEDNRVLPEMQDSGITHDPDECKVIPVLERSFA